MQQPFSFEKTPIKDLVMITPFYSEDDRGYFLKAFEKEIFETNGISTEIFEDFETHSKKGVIRGLHFQTKNPQAKLVRAITGEIFDVAVDLRKDSETYGQWYGTTLSEINKKAFFIPKGFAHGFLVLSETALVSYKCEGKFSKETDTGIYCKDSDLNIQWPIKNEGDIFLSEKDRNLPYFKDYEKSQA